MTREYIITMTAENRVGILAAVTNAMAELGAELREASQTIVRDFFTMIFAAEFPDDLSEQVILDHLCDVCRPWDIEVVLKQNQRGDSGSEHASESPLQRLRIKGRNAPGLLRQIAGRMSNHHVDIVGLHAWRDDAESAFEIVMKIAVPAGFSADELITSLQELEPQLELQAELEDY